MPPEASKRSRKGIAPAGVQIELDADASGGFINGRFDILLRGRVVSSTPVEALELMVGANPVSRIDYGEPLRAATTTMPDGTPGRECSFQFTLHHEQASAARESVVQIRVMGSDRLLGKQDFTIVTDTSRPDSVQVTSGPRRPMLSLIGTRPPVILYVERASLTEDGAFVLRGWTVAMNALITVQAFLGEHRLPAAQLGVLREDVGLLYANYPNARGSGFTLNTQVSRRPACDAQVVRVQAISRNGYSQQVLVPVERLPAQSRGETKPAPDPVTGLKSAVPTQNLQVVADAAFGTEAKPEQSKTTGPQPGMKAGHEIRHFCDEMLFQADGTLCVIGWAVCEAGLAEIAVELDGKLVGLAELGLPRPDVGEQFFSIPSAKSAGFRFEEPFPDIVEGEHAVRIVLRNEHGEERSETRRVRATKPIPTTRNRDLPRISDRPEFRFELDNPQVVSGSVVEPVTGRLTIEGWVLARSGVLGVDVYLDDQRLGEAHYGLARQDVGAAFPDWNDALRSGYAFHCPPRALRDGEHVVRLEVRARDGQVLQRSFRIDVKKSDEDDQLATIRRRIGYVEARMQAGLLERLGYQPRFHLVLQLGSVRSVDALRATLDALRNQIYRSWQATVLAEDSDAGHAARRWLAEHEAEFDGRVAVLDDSQPAFDAPLIAAGQDDTLFGLLFPGDLLGCDALAEIALAGGLHRQPDFLYADEARLSPASKEREPFFKPDFSPDLLLSTNYIGRPWFAKGSLLRECSVTARSLFADGEYDLVLRCTERAHSIHHVRKLLAQRASEAVEDEEASRIALARAAERREFAAQVKPGCLPGIFRLQRSRPATGKVSIIIPTCAAHGHIETCIRTLRSKTAYKNFEIVCIDNIPAAEPRWKVWLQQNADQIVDIPDAFNWSRFNNMAVDATCGEYLLFLNDDIEVTQPDWLDALLEHAQRAEVGIVGPQLLYPGGKVQHAGMFLGAGIGRHAFRFAPHDDPGYFGLALTQRNVIAVTGACMLMRRSFFEAMGGFEEAHSVINNDLDFCLRAHESGKLTVYTPYATLLHHELASRGGVVENFDSMQFDARWRTIFAAGDPYFSPRLSRNADDYRPDDEAMQTIFAGHPLFDPMEIQRILVVKLDHIGDVVTALPAIQRLKELFPHASLCLLAGRAARSVISLEPAIDEFIEFDFFHARSQLGEKQLASEDFEALRERLAPYRFDLAIDLRKHLSTRDVLRYTGARFLAGYDYAGQFPFLDIALEWDGDKTLLRKRSHVADDLLALVAAVGTASMPNRDVLSTPVEPIPLQNLPEPTRALFERPVVAIHAGAGTVTRQWPEEHFSALIDLLLERDLVNVVLVGGPDDCERSDRIIRRASHPDRVGSVAGVLSLADLPRLLARCRLYVGSNSGPQHIAAAVGIAAIGIHSGVVDAIEWGPLGRQAVALRRNMTCSPCYLARAEDCPRGLACLRQLEPSAVHEVAQSLLARPVPAPVDLGQPMSEAAALSSNPQISAAQPPSMQAAKRTNGKAMHAKSPGQDVTQPRRQPKSKLKRNRQGAPA